MINKLFFFSKKIKEKAVIIYYKTYIINKLFFFSKKIKENLVIIYYKTQIINKLFLLLKENQKSKWLLSTIKLV